MIEGKHDLALSVAVEVLPKVELKELGEIKVEKLVAEVSDADVDETVERIAKSNRSFAAKDGAGRGRRPVTIDFVGKIDGEPFKGGSADGHRARARLGRVHPRLRGAARRREGGRREGRYRSSSPSSIAAAELAGKAATFDVKVKAVAAPGESRSTTSSPRASG